MLIRYKWNHTKFLLGEIAWNKNKLRRGMNRVDFEELKKKKKIQLTINIQYSGKQ